MGSPSRNVQYHPPRLSEDRLNLPQPHSPSFAYTLLREIGNAPGPRPAERPHKAPQPKGKPEEHRRTRTATRARSGPTREVHAATADRQERTDGRHAGTTEPRPQGSGDGPGQEPGPSDVRNEGEAAARGAGESKNRTQDAAPHGRPRSVHEHATRTRFLLRPSATAASERRNSGHPRPPNRDREDNRERHGCLGPGSVEPPRMRRRA